MTDRRDLSVVAADDALLDALGQGGRAPDGDAAGALLAAWRMRLSVGVEEPTPAPVAAVPVAAPVRIGRPARRRWVRPAIAAAAAVLVVGGVGVGTATATPGSPLWPVAAAVDPQRADIHTADSKLAAAREAIDQGRYPDARRLVDQAADAAARVRDPAQASRLATDIAQVRRRLVAATEGDPTGSGRSAPTPKPAPSPRAGAPSATGTSPSPVPSGSAHPQPGSSTGGGLGGLLPSLPIPNVTSILPILP